MSLRYIGTIITACRKDTGETDFSDDNGTPNDIAIEAAKEGVQHCQNVLVGLAPKTFEILTELAGVSGQVEYELPENTYIGSSIAFVRYSTDGDNKNYYNLALKDYGYFRGGNDTEPQRFTNFGERSILIDPVLSSSVGKFQVSHGAYLDSPALRSGKISARTISGDGLSYTDITLDSGDATLDDDAVAADEFICVNDVNGVVKFRNLQYTYNSSTHVLTLVGSALLADGSVSVGDYITVGKYTTTHPKLSLIAEPILKSYIRRRFYLGKSSEDVIAENDNIKVFTEEMVNAYSKQVRSQKKVPYTGRFEGV